MIEEGLIDGVLHWRDDPGYAWIPYTLEELGAKYLSIPLAKDKTLRDYYAGQVLGRRSSEVAFSDPAAAKKQCTAYFAIADAMMEARKG